MKRRNFLSTITAAVGGLGVAKFVKADAPKKTGTDEKADPCQVACSNVSGKVETVPVFSSGTPVKRKWSSRA